MRDGIICAVFMFFLFWFSPLTAVFVFEDMPTLEVMFAKIISISYIKEHHDMFLFNFLVSVAFGYCVYSTKKDKDR